MSVPRKILLDTDIGTDIDDAACLAYLLEQPRCQLLGITTVCSDVGTRASLASALCRAAGREDIPIHAGLGKPLLVDPNHGKANQAEALARWPHRQGFEPGRAVTFLQETIRRHQHQIDLLTIGPLTNIAALFTIDPEAATLLRSLTIMGGAISRRYWGRPTEYNIYCDPHALQIVLQAEVARLRLVPLDVTTQLVMSGAEVRERFTHPLLKVVADFSRSWFAHREELTFHDPLTAVTLFRDEVCGFDRGTVRVELGASKELEGFTHWKEDPAGRHEVALRVDAGGFFEEYFSVFGAQD